MDAIIYFFTSLSVLNFVLASVCFLIGLFLGCEASEGKKRKWKSINKGRGWVALCV